jgi:hypothetical protein
MSWNTPQTVLNKYNKKMRLFSKKIFGQFLPILATFYEVKITF